MFYLTLLPIISFESVQKLVYDEEIWEGGRSLTSTVIDPILFVKF